MKKLSVEFNADYILFKGIFPENSLAVFSLRSMQENCAFTDRENLRTSFLHKFGFTADSIASAEQVHGAEVASVDSSGCVQGADGLVTSMKDLALTVAAADCLPVYLWSASGNCIGLLHAGWRGSSQKITKNGVRTIVEKYNVDAHNLFALLGPCICQKCYEIGPEVAVQFHPDSIVKEPEGRFHLDLRVENYQQLLKSGLPGEHIHSCDLCTSCHEDIFFSYRRDGQGTGRMIAALALLNSIDHGVQEDN